MRFSPIEIQQKQFTVKWRGFDMDEVYSFLEIVREELEELLRENASLKDKLQRAEDQLKEYARLDATLRETLLTTQQMVEDYRRNAQKEAEMIVKEAELKAEEMIKQAQLKAIKIHEDVTDLKGLKRHFKEEIRRLIESHLRMLEYDDKERDNEEGSANTQ